MPAKGHKLSNEGSRAHRCGDTGGVGQNGPCKRPTAPGKRCYAHDGDGADMLDAALTQRIVGTVKVTGLLDPAARVNGISPITARSWMEKGQADPHGPYGEFFREVDKARADVETEVLESIRLAGLGFESTKTRIRTGLNGETTDVITETRSDWRAAVAYLEKANPRKYRENLGSMKLKAKDAEKRGPIRITQVVEHYKEPDEGEDDE